MPPRGRKRRGKELVAAVATDAPGDAAVSPEYVEAVVAELEHESERRVKKLKRQMGDMRQEFLNHFQVELLKIPRKIREMKVEHFSSEFGGRTVQELAIKGDLFSPLWPRNHALRDRTAHPDVAAAEITLHIRRSVDYHCGRAVIAKVRHSA